MHRPCSSLKRDPPIPFPVSQHFPQFRTIAEIVVPAPAVRRHAPSSLDCEDARSFFHNLLLRFADVPRRGSEKTPCSTAMSVQCNALLRISARYEWSPSLRRSKNCRRRVIRQTVLKGTCNNYYARSMKSRTFKFVRPPSRCFDTRRLLFSNAELVPVPLQHVDNERAAADLRQVPSPNLRCLVGSK
jgi:hypothetical protein